MQIIPDATCTPKCNYSSVWTAALHSLPLFSLSFLASSLPPSLLSFLFIFAFLSSYFLIFYLSFFLPSFLTSCFLAISLIKTFLPIFLLYFVSFATFLPVPLYILYIYCRMKSQGLTSTRSKTVSNYVRDMQIHCLEEVKSYVVKRKDE